MNKLILIVGVCFFYLALTAPAAISTDTAKTHINAESGQQTIQQTRLLIAQDNADAQAAGDPGSNPENQSEPNAEKKTKQEALPSEANTDPLPSYEPSEKIKADQAVDFPYDI